MLGLAAQILRKPSGILPPRARFRAHGHNAAEHVPADKNALFPLAAVHAEILDRIDPRAGTGKREAFDIIHAPAGEIDLRAGAGKDVPLREREGFFGKIGLALIGPALRPMSTSQYAAQKKPKSHIIVLCAQLAVYLAAGFLAGWRTGVALCGCLAGYALALRKAFCSLDGMNGDIAGYALTIGELCAVAVYALL